MCTFDRRKKAGDPSISASWGPLAGLPPDAARQPRVWCSWLDGGGDQGVDPPPLQWSFPTPANPLAE